MNMQKQNLSSIQYRTHKSSQVNASLEGQSIKLAGWVRKKRDHGPIIFIDLADNEGTVQCIAQNIEKSADSAINSNEIFQVAEKLSNESIICIEGIVTKRSKETINNKISSGEVEIQITKIEIISHAQELPFALSQPDLSQELQLKYRYLYLRRPDMQEVLKIRTNAIRLMREAMQELGFQEIQTPILASSSPEGARDYVVPSRLHPGKFYALPQAPQQFKQILMASGVEKYFQVAPCFRDEDARADRLVGEFYQLDFEMAFAGQEEVFSVLEHVLYHVFHTIRPEYEIPKRFPRITYQDAIAKYGSDKPDLRNPLELCDITNEPAPNIFQKLIDNKGKLIALSAKVENLSNAFFTKLTKQMMDLGAKGLAYCVHKEGKWSGPLANMYDDSVKEKILKGTDHNAIFLIADEKNIAYKLAGQLRDKLGRELNLINEKKFAFCLITDFPMFEWNENKSGKNKWDFMHNPFSMPQNPDASIEDIVSYQYDIVCNGYELSSGAVRNHDLALVKKMFQLIDLDCENIEEAFPVYKAFKHGIPPHAGAAPGIDRIIMLLSERTNVRDIVPFPLNQHGENLLMEAPSEITQELLDELQIKVKKNQK